MPETSDLERWTDEARTIPREQAASKMPIHVQTSEAVDLSKVVVRYWAAEMDSRTGAVVRPGLESLGERLPATTAEDLLSQQRALQEAQTAYLLAAGQRATDPEPRARFVFRELVLALKFLFDDGVEDQKDAHLASVQASHARRPNTTYAFAMDLQSHATLAQAHEAELKGLGGFDVALIPEAFELTAALRSKPTIARVYADPRPQEALRLRNQLSALLARTVSNTRRAIRFVFRNHPEVIRESTSAYERRKRAASRRNKQKATDGKPQPGTNE